MPLGDLVAIAQQLGDEGRRDFGNEVLQRGIASAEQVNAEASKPVHDRLWVEVLAGVGAGEQPW